MREDIQFEEIGSRVMTELNRRLATPELAKELPGTLLMKVAMDYVKHLERRNEIEQAKLDAEKIDPMEMIDQEGLPINMRIEILAAYLDELEAVWRNASAKMVELLEEVGDDGEVVQEVQEVGAEG